MDRSAIGARRQAVGPPESAGEVGLVEIAAIDRDRGDRSGRRGQQPGGAAQPDRPRILADAAPEGAAIARGEADRIAADISGNFGEPERGAGIGVDEIPRRAEPGGHGRRAAIGAGTSSLALGTSAGTAKAGDWKPASTDITDSTSTGRAVVTAATQDAARQGLGVFLIQSTDPLPTPGSSPAIVLRARA